MTGFHNVLQLLSQAIDVDYSSYFILVRNELYKLFNTYENKFGVWKDRDTLRGGWIRCSKNLRLQAHIKTYFNFYLNVH